MGRSVQVKNTVIGDGKVTIQSMTNVKTYNVEAVIAQIQSLALAGCDIVRVSVPDERSALALRDIVEKVTLPVVADIHYDYRLAILAVENGAHKIRINPGNIGGADRLEKICSVCKAHRVPIRVGVNSGSIEPELLKQYGATPKALVESAIHSVRLLEKQHFEDIVVSAKSSGVRDTIVAYRALAKEISYPLHVGVTEAGTRETGLVKSSIGIGALLADGIGDTIRVSLTGDPVEEVVAAREILRALRLDTNYVEIISCPTCSRTVCDVYGMASKIRELTKDITMPLRIAVMGCTVNGLGEGKSADLGIAGGVDKSIIFQHGERIMLVENERLYPEFVKILTSMVQTLNKHEK